MFHGNPFVGELRIGTLQFLCLDQNTAWKWITSISLADPRVRSSNWFLLDIDQEIHYPMQASLRNEKQPQATISNSGLSERACGALIPALWGSSPGSQSLARPGAVGWGIIRGRGFSRGLQTLFFDIYLE